MKKYNPYEICSDEVLEGFKSLIKHADHSSDRDVFGDFLQYVNKEHDAIFFELLHQPNDYEINNFLVCKEHRYRLLQRQKSVISVCNQERDIGEIRAKLKELKEYLKKLYRRLSVKKRLEIKSKIKDFSQEVIIMNNLLVMKDLDYRSESNLSNEHQNLLKSMKEHVKYDSKNRKYELDFSKLINIKKRKGKKR
ncbi:hypothetical protein [Pseudoalteromonas peptidolytica]|uniref:Uncharacterized protein n=1 Tax=Pseudoalteromonas peptidolytica F12-50-A1 TaxID=1315280 RepID=A0A8I0MSF7_9GAMM|nr:hypothetical protein [Pseudoalteromonas peptidolytica]MBE0344962.1 hypothetical protein [Pseudoalteromonas peptidolytica F12-50-A1]NLR15569.1 hypothetical protein [Pseudoalteromonas peptidolytica]GEK08315.1 hypothetical protein PPE03_05640 [Pseudoalteromonas peptidolytica]